MRPRLFAGGALLLLGLAGGLFALPPLVERIYNPVARPPPYAAAPRAAALHRTLRLVDLHADTLLWGRDLLAHGARGHVDVPRLVAGHVALQVFGIVNRVPLVHDYRRTAPGPDAVTLLAIAGRWPPATWTSRTERVLYQARRLAAAAARSDGRLTLVRSAADLADYLARRRRGEDNITAALLGVEGADALDGDPANLDRLFAAGVRMLAPTHFLDNAFGGSAHGVRGGGLTVRGRRLLRMIEARGMVLDLAHASERLFAEAVALATRPVVVSHTGVRGTCDRRRNLGDGQLRAVAATGGVVGIGYWPAAVCGHDARAVARAIRHAVDVAGIRHVALGSDFDGAVAAPFDASGLVVLTEALLETGFDEREIRLVMGENALRVLGELLPRGAALQ